MTSAISNGCAGGAAALPQLLAHGGFFKGAGEDAIAYLMVERRSDDLSLPAKTLRVGGSTTGTTPLINVDLGTVKVGEPAVATLTWDQTGNAFVWRVVKVFTTPHVVEETGQYVQEDTEPPDDPFKSLRVGTFAPGCAESVAGKEVVIDNVRVNP